MAPKKNMKAKPKQQEPRARPHPSMKQMTLPAVLLLCTAAISPVSQLSLAPVFGSIPSSVNHNLMITITFGLGFVLRSLKDYLPQWLNRRTFPLWAAWVPVIQCLILPFSGRLGPVGGPILNGIISCHSILVPSAYATAEAWEIVSSRLSVGRSNGNLIMGTLLVAIFRGLEKNLIARCSDLLGAFHFLTPVHLQLLLASCYSMIFPSWLLGLALPAFLHAQFMNPHFTSSAVDSSLQTHNWTIVDRQWSNTGYVSVLDSSNAQYRVMRCDHSLLGGEWLLTESRQTKEGWKVNEPIYAVFEMLEAVRLMQVEPAILDTEAQALVIGLGIGTAPKALVEHGIETTVVELDPVVHEFATRYFGLPANHTAVIQDAVSWVRQEVGNQEDGNSKRYQYIIHDVFTGGAEPLALFNADFLSNLRALLAPNGVIALNYAGDLSLPLTQRVLNTIDHVFTGQCKIFRDGPPSKHGAPEAGDPEAGDFLNMVVFCRNSQGDITFRNPRQADYLGSKSRMYYMLPKPEHEIPFPRYQQRANPKDTSSKDRRDALYNAQHGHAHPQLQILELGDEGKFAWQQAASAIRHWHIMRTVLPDAVWDLW